MRIGRHPQHGREGQNHLLRRKSAFSEKQSKRASERWENSENPNENNDPPMPLAAMPIQPQTQPDKKEEGSLTAAASPSAEGKVVQLHRPPAPEGRSDPQPSPPIAPAPSPAVYAFEEERVRIAHKDLDKLIDAYPNVNVLGTLHALSGFGAGEIFEAADKTSGGQDRELEDREALQILQRIERKLQLPMRGCG